METYDELKEGEKGAWTSIAAYLLLAAVKIGTGFYTGSEALTADGVNNTTDILVSVAVLIGLRISRKPPDLDHPYGHMRAQTIATLVASFVMATAGIQVVIEAGRSFFEANRPVPDMLAAWVAIACAAVMWGVYLYNSRLAKRINNQALAAAAQDNRSDAFVSIGAAVGIVGASFGIGWLDPAAAFAVGLIICKTAWGIFTEATHMLSDGFDEQKLRVFSKTVKETPGVKRIKDIRARAHGNNVLLDVVVEVSRELSVEQSHDISDDIEKRMMEQHAVESVHVHVEPCSRDT